MKYIASFILIFTVVNLVGQTDIYKKKNYEKSYIELDSMLSDLKPYDLKRAVFIVENAYAENQYNYFKFKTRIIELAALTTLFADANKDNFIYNEDDKENILLHASLFNLITDSVTLKSEGDTYYHLPFTYDFKDFDGTENWGSMFVTKLLKSKKGNCHSLPFLYKILADELGIESNLALAPNHIYLKNKSKKTGMYNTELTSASFPIDAWLMASGYIHLNAIRNGLYMEALNNKQTLALCMIDLAQGYQRKFNTNDEFIVKCCETALEHFPNYINALLLKASNIKNQLDVYVKNNSVTHLSEIFYIPKAKELFSQYETLIMKIHELGYRKMPNKMYMEWLLDLRENEEKYSNKKINTNFNSNN